MNPLEKQSFNITLRSFESQILYFNGTYKLPVAPYPSFKVIEEKDTVFNRMQNFKRILTDELQEIDTIVESVKEGKQEVDILTDMADLLGDIMVYCASEMAKYGIPQKETLAIIMSSNFSKLDSNGNPIYDSTGKVLKGPNYWKPEPMLKKMLEDKIAEHRTSNPR